MPIDFTKYGRPLTQEEVATIPPAPEKKPFLRKAAEFVAPTATGLITGEKELTPRTATGAALEIASFAPPLGFLRGIATGARFLPRVSKVAPEAVNLALRAREAALAGGVGGAMFGAGRALGEEQKTPREILTEAVMAGGVGATGGAVLAPATILATRGVKTGAKYLSDNIKKIFRTINPTERNSSIEELTQGYFTSFVEDSPSIFKALEKEMVKARRKGGPDTEIGLLRELAEEGYIPKIEGSVARMRPVIDSLSQTMDSLSRTLDTFLRPIKTKTSMAELWRRTTRELKERTDIDPIAVRKDLTKIFGILKEKYGLNLSAVQLNAIRKEMNKRTKAFKTEKFVQDAADAIADATRERLDELVPTGQVRRINEEMAKLLRMQRVASILDNQKIKVEFWGEALGRFAGTVGGASVGLQVAGPGGLVVAGVLANAGSRIVAQMIRRARFNPKLQRVIQSGLSHDRRILDKLIREATPEDAKILKEATKQLPKEMPIGK